MLPTINLQLTGMSPPSDLTAGVTAGETGPLSSLAAGSLPPDARFSDLLRQPVAVILPPDAGQALPLDGSLLPAAVKVLDNAGQLLGTASAALEPEAAWRPSGPETLAVQPLVPLDASEEATFDAADALPSLPSVVVAEQRLTPAQPGRTAPLQPESPAIRTELATAVAATGRVQAEASAGQSLGQSSGFAPGLSPAPSTSLEAATTLLAEPAARSLDAPSPRSVDAAPLPASAQGPASAPSASPTLVSGSAAAAPQTAVQTSIALPVTDPGWGEVLNERVVILSAQNIKTAEIRLSPAELGPIRVSVAVDDGTANLSFSAQHSLTREAIESALPRLREMLSEQGLSLGNTSVTDYGTGDDTNRLPTDAEADLARGELTPGGGDADEAAILPSVRVSRGLIDTFV